MTASGRRQFGEHQWLSVNWYQYKSLVIVPTSLACQPPQHLQFFVLSAQKFIHGSRGGHAPPSHCRERSSHGVSRQSNCLRDSFPAAFASLCGCLLKIKLWGLVPCIGIKTLEDAAGIASEIRTMANSASGAYIPLEVWSYEPRPRRLS